MTINFATFLAWEATFNDAFIVRRAYVRMAGDLNAGILLSRIVYYYLPNRDGKSRLRVNRDNKLWIAKARDDWQNEICLTGKQVDRASKILEDKALIEKATFKYGGAPTTHVRLRIDNFLSEWSALLESAENVEILSTFPDSSRDLKYKDNVFNKSKLSTQDEKDIDNNDSEDEIVYCPSCKSTKTVSLEHDPKGRCAYCLLLAAWKYYFPEKPQPRSSTKEYRRMSETRWKNKHFRENYRTALARASKSLACQRESWFHFKFFVKNGEHYQLMLDKWMDWKDDKIRAADKRGQLAKEQDRKDSGLGQM